MEEQGDDDCRAQEYQQVGASEAVGRFVSWLAIMKVVAKQIDAL